MKQRYFLLITIVFVSSVYCFADQQALPVIKTLLDQYKRAITVVEIGVSAADHTLAIAQHCKSTVAAIVINTEQAQALANTVVAQELSNVVVMNPPVLDAFNLAMLGKCEHFDVVIVQDVGLFDKDIMTTMQNILQLGDHVFVVLTAQEIKKLGTAVFADIVPVIVPLAGDRALYYFDTPKTTLFFARWAKTMYDQDKVRNYTVKSNFVEKKLCKDTGESQWIRGINLVTFVMLHGIFPTDKIIRHHLRSFKYIDHNDLVVANMIVQGSAIIPIDFKDKRRNIDPRVCVKAAKKVFSWNRRMRNPQQVMEKYVEYIQKHKRRMPEPPIGLGK